MTSRKIYITFLIFFVTIYNHIVLVYNSVIKILKKKKKKKTCIEKKEINLTDFMLNEEKRYKALLVLQWPCDSLLINPKSKPCIAQKNLVRPMLC